MNVLRQFIPKLEMKVLVVCLITIGLLASSPGEGRAAAGPSGDLGPRPTLPPAVRGGDAMLQSE